MPEGPSIILVKEAAEKFTGKKVLSVYGNTTAVDKNLLLHKKVIAFRSWGKHLLICFSSFTIRIHFLMFGSYSVDEEKDKPVRLGLEFTNGKLFFYTCSVKVIEGDIDTIYDWSADVMNNAWNEKAAKEKLKQHPEKMICDTLLEQDIFSGVGNIIKNEILYRTHVHPESKTGKIPASKINTLIKQARLYSFEFLKWKRLHILREQWQVYTQTICHRCHLPIIRKNTGVKKRRSFFCTNCQTLYT